MMSAGPTADLKFPRDRRLKLGRDFARLKRQGQRVVRGCLIANWAGLPAGQRPRLGVVTSRQLGPAVTRSRARRLLRESFRLHQADLNQPVDMVLVARSSIVGKNLAEVENDYLAVLRGARLLKESE